MKSFIVFMSILHEIIYNIFSTLHGGIKSEGHQQRTLQKVRRNHVQNAPRSHTLQTRRSQISCLLQRGTLKNTGRYNEKEWKVRIAYHLHGKISQIFSRTLGLDTWNDHETDVGARIQSASLPQEKVRWVYYDPSCQKHPAASEYPLVLAQADEALG